MKRIFFKIASFSLALLVLLSTLSFTVEKHYCGELLMDIAFVGHTDGCGMEMNTPAVVMKKNCCKDEVHKVEGQDELQQHAPIALVFKGYDSIISYQYATKDLFEETPSRKLLFNDFSPPYFPINYQVLYQSFLI